MEKRGMPFLEARSKLIPIGVPIEEVRAWRTAEAVAGRPSGLDDFCRTRGIYLCPICEGEGVIKNDNGIGFKPVGWEDGVQLFEQCEQCGGTGRKFEGK